MAKKDSQDHSCRQGLDPRAHVLPGARRLFSLVVSREGDDDFHVLIDCGTITGTEGVTEKMKAVIQNIANDTKNHLHLLVVTHEHWDHISGFADPDLFDDFDIDEVWLAWTEDDDNAITKRLQKARADKLKKLQFALGALQKRLGGDDELTQTLKPLVEQTAEVFSFFGIEPAEALLGAAGGAKTGEIMKWLKTRAAIS